MVEKINERLIPFKETSNYFFLRGRGVHQTNYPDRKEHHFTEYTMIKKNSFCHKFNKAVLF